MADELIYRNALIAAYDAAHKGPPGGARKLMQEAPAVDAAPVVHGRWEFCGDDDLVCGVCRARYFKRWLLQSYYTGPGSDKMDGFWHCPHCGALLDGGESDLNPLRDPLKDNAVAPTCGPDYCEIEGGGYV